MSKSDELREQLELAEQLAEVTARIRVALPNRPELKALREDLYEISDLADNVGHQLDRVAKRLCPKRHSDFGKAIRELDAGISAIDAKRAAEAGAETD